MNVVRTELDGPLIIEPRIFADARGYFFESYSERDFSRLVCGTHFVQDNESRSCYAVVRGLHFQRPPFAQAKLVRCISGRVLDVALDIRKGSPTYGRHISVELSRENHRQLFIPAGFAHGFSVLSGEAVFAYKCDNFYAPDSEDGINLLDSDLDIDWGVPAGRMLISEKDRSRGSFRDFETPFRYE